MTTANLRLVFMWMISRNSLACTPGPNEAGLFGGVEMAGDGVANHGLEFGERIGFGENGETEGAGLEAAFGRFFDGEDDSVGGMSFFPIQR